MICLKSYGTHSQKLADEISTLARHLATDTTPHYHISTLFACRLVPLKKKHNSIRPVGVGKCLRWIIGKTITRLFKGRHHSRRRNTTDMCWTGIRHGSSNTFCKEKFSRWKHWIPAIGCCRKRIQQIKQKSPSRKHQKIVSAHTQQLQHYCYTVFRKQGPHTVWGGCGTRWQCSSGNVYYLHMTIDTRTKHWNLKWWCETGMFCGW